jgi:hypothetical protein
MVAPMVKRAGSGCSECGSCVVRLGHAEAPGSHGSGSDVAPGPSSPCQPHLLFQSATAAIRPSSRREHDEQLCLYRKQHHFTHHFVSS